MTPGAASMRQNEAGEDAARRWRFGRAEFDERALSLTVDSRTIEIEPKPLRALRHLLVHAGNVVTKDALVRAVWPGRIITDAALTKCIARLREAIGDREQTLIRTHHGFGYRFSASVEVDMPGPASSTPPIAAPVRTLDTAAAPAAHAAAERRDTERRPLAVLFCDLVGSAELSEQLEPEVFRERLLDYQRQAETICVRYGGRVAQQFGDGLLLHFGYPVAHDDDTERALRCACDLLATLTRARAGAKLSLRIGVHTGQVVVGQAGPRGEAVATGASVHLAARLLALAEPDTILISDASFRLVPGLFVTRNFGAQQIRGLKEPVRVYQVLQPSGVRSRLEAAARLTPFVGRKQEIDLLSECWRSTINGEGQAILFSGEPGLGKSRLLLEVRARLAGSAHSWLECRADALNRHSAYQPLVELLKRGLAMKEGDNDAQRLERLEQGLADVGLDSTQAVPLLGPLLSIPLPPRYPALTLAPALRRRRTLRTLADWLQRLAHQQPLVIAFEDLHWIDDTSLDFLGEVLGRIASLPVLLVMTARTEFQSPWPIRPPLHLRSLDPLLLSQVEQMLGDLTGGATLTPTLSRLIFEQAGGVPLFVEELTRSLLESGQIVERDGRLDAAVPLGQLAIPGSLHGLLLARLDRLGPARELIQTAAVIGREIPYRLLQLVAGLPDATLQKHLNRIADTGLLHRRPDASYIFKHALIRDSAYETLLKPARERLHGAVAQALETHFPERAQREPEVLAAHFESANLVEPAVRWYKAAAERSEAATSMQEAIAHCEHALRLLTQLGQTPQRTQLELDLSLILGNCRLATSGYGHAELRSLFERVRELAERMQDPVLVARALCQISVMHWNRAEFLSALESADRLERLGRETGDDTVRHLGLASRGRPLVHLGHLSACAETCEQAYALVTPERATAVLRILPYDVHNYPLIALMHAQWLMGRPDAALETMHRALACSTRARHPHAITWSLAQGMTAILIFRREPEPVLEWGRKATELAERHVLVELLAHAQQHFGLACCMLGRFAEGQALLDAASSARRGYRTAVMNSVHAVIEAEQYRRFGRHAEARSTLAGAFEGMEKTGERFWEAELHRVRGELLLVDGDSRAQENAEACFQKALSVARAQGARSLELRAATSLARLWQGRDQVVAAGELLKRCYEGFTEGFSTPDLLEAREQLLALDRHRWSPG